MHKYLCSSSRESGQSAVEFSLIAATLVLIIFIVVDLGRAMSIYSFIAGAAQAGARAGSVSTDVAVIEAAAQSRMSGFDSSTVAIGVVQSGNYTEVTLTYTFQPIVPLVATALGTNALTLKNTARVRRLGTVGGGGSPTPGSTPVPQNTPVSTNTPVPTATSCWPPGHCK
ncbi:MAG: pilus assembly protein [Caldilineaceae bacterium]|nr:pilus assembly protein [Caldilineaceae bacterium]